MGDTASPDLAALSKQLVSTDPEQRAAAAEQFSQAGEEAAVAAVPLVAACGDADDRVREFAVAALEDLGPPLAADIPPLIKLVDSPDALAAYWAITLLGRSGKNAAEAVAVLVASVESSADLSVRQRAAWALGKIGPAAGAARGTLKRAAGQGDERLARLAKEALESIGG